MVLVDSPLRGLVWVQEARAVVQKTPGGSDLAAGAWEDRRVRGLYWVRQNAKQLEKVAFVRNGSYSTR